MRTCSKCSKNKSLDHFYKQQNYCKLCQRDYAKQYYQARKKEYADRQRAYLSSEKGKATRAANDKQRYLRDPRLKVRADTRNAIKRGDLIKQPCELCGCPDVEAHHDDYSKPLDVRWLCVPHHREHHIGSK